MAIESLKKFSENQNPSLDRSLGLLEALCVVVGRIIGSGIFRTPGPIFIAVCGLDLHTNYQGSDIPLGQLSVGLFFLAWIIGGVVTYLNALCYGELVGLLPYSGGPYAYLRAAYPEVITFLRGWAMFFVSETASIVAVALVFSQYASILLNKLSGLPLNENVTAAIALALIWSLSFVNCFGVVLSGILQNIFSFMKIFALLTMCGLFLGIGGNADHFQSYFWPNQWGWATLLGLGQAMRYAFFAYSGWEGATYVAEEVRDPKRKLPLSLFIGIGLVMLIYLAVNAGYVYQLGPLQIISARKQIAATAMDAVLGTSGAVLLALFITLSTGSNVSTQILVKARTWYAMARDGIFFERMAKLNPKYHTPNSALVLQASWASVLLFFSLSFENSYEAMIDFFSFTSALFNILTFAAVWILRKKMADAPRSFTVPCFSLTLSLVLLVQFFFLLITLYDRPIESLLGIGLSLSGLIYYFYKKRGQRLTT